MVYLLDSTTHLVAFFSAGLGACGALFFILSYFIYTDLRTKSRQLLLFLSFADLCQAFRFLFISLDNISPKFCLFQSVFGILAAESSFFWTACISIYVYLVIKAPSRLFPNWGVQLFHLISWGYPICFSMLMLVLNINYTNESDVPWCFLRPHTPTDWKLLGYSLPLIFCWFVTTVMYFLASSEISRGAHFIPHSNVHKSHEAEIRELQTKFHLIPLVFVLLRIWDVAYHLYYAWNPHAVPIGGWYLNLMVIGDSSQGFFNCLIFIFLTRNIRDRIKCSCFSTCFQPTEECKSVLHTNTSYTENA